MTIYSIHKTANVGNKELFLAEARNISDTLELELAEYAAASRAIVLSPVFIDILEKEDKHTQDEVVEQFREYLKDFSKHFNYSTISIVSEKSKKYYTNLGFNKVMDLENDPHDVWYKLFLDLNTTFDFDMDFDEANGNKWTLFANVRINNAKGELLGVSGFGRDLAYLKDMLLKLENDHKLKVYFIDDKGNVVLGALSDNIKDRLLSKEVRKDETYFKLDEEEDKFIAARYIDQIGWTLVVEKKKNIVELLFGLVKLNFITTLITLVVFIVASSIIIHKKQSQLIGLGQKDGLTGILNRRGGEEKITDLLKNARMGGMFCLIDADNFKQINDTFGHSVGDEVIKKVAKSLSKISRSGDVIFRLGGDEFGFFAKGVTNAEKASDILERFFTELNSEKLAVINNQAISVSAGLTFVLVGDDFLSIYERADKALYESKEIEGCSIHIR